MADTFKDTPPDLKIALEGVARFSDTLNTRDAQLRNLLADANKVTAVLASAAIRSPAWSSTPTRC